MRYGFVIPVYNHGSTLEAVVQKLTVHNLPIIVIDDGNDEYNKAFIKLVAEKYQLVDVVVHKKNCGKGKAAYGAANCHYDKSDSASFHIQHPWLYLSALP